MFYIKPCSRLLLLVPVLQIGPYFLMHLIRSIVVQLVPVLHRPLDRVIHLPLGSDWVVMGFEWLVAVAVPLPHRQNQAADRVRPREDRHHQLALVVPLGSGQVVMESTGPNQGQVNHQSSYSIREMGEWEIRFLIESNWAEILRFKKKLVFMITSRILRISIECR